MKLKSKTNWIDLKEDKDRVTGEIFEVTKERAEIIIAANFAEVFEGEKPAAKAEPEVKPVVAKTTKTTRVNKKK